MTKAEMIEAMNEGSWCHDMTMKNTYAEVKEEYETMLEEYEAAEEDMYPNGRDYDAEDFD